MYIYYTYICICREDLEGSINEWNLKENELFIKGKILFSLELWNCFVCSFQLKKCTFLKGFWQSVWVQLQFLTPQKNWNPSSFSYIISHGIQADFHFFLSKYIQSFLAEIYVLITENWKLSIFIFQTCNSIRKVKDKSIYIFILSGK